MGIQQIYQNTKVIKCDNYIDKYRKQIAEDITQETFLRCFTKGRDFKGKSSLKTWLYQIAINLCKDYLKSAYNARVIINNEVVQLKSNHAFSAENLALNNINFQNITDFILTLPEKYREIIVLYYFKEFQVKEISDTLSISENTVKTRLRRSRDLIKKGMNSDE